MISAGSRLGGLAGINLVTLKPSNAWIAYAIPLIVIGIGLMIAQSGMRPQKRTRFSGLVSGVAERVTGMVMAPFKRRQAAADRN